MIDRTRVHNDELDLRGMLIFLVIPLLDMLLVLIVIDRIGAVYDVLALRFY